MGGRVQDQICTRIIAHSNDQVNWLSEWGDEELGHEWGFQYY